MNNWAEFIWYIHFYELLLCYLLLLVELSTFAPDEWIPGNGWRLIVVVVVLWGHGGRQLRSGNAPDVGRWTTSAGNHRWHVIITQTGSLCHVVNRGTHTHNNNNRQELFPGHSLSHTHTHQKLFPFFFLPPQRRMAAVIFFVRVVFLLSAGSCCVVPVVAALRTYMRCWTVVQNVAWWLSCIFHRLHFVDMSSLATCTGVEVAFLCSLI
jgi:hypothetical protein